MEVRWLSAGRQKFSPTSRFEPSWPNSIPDVIRSAIGSCFLLSIKAGLRAKEVASVTWAMVTDAEGEIADVIALENRASKGKGGGRHIPIHPDLKPR